MAKNDLIKKGAMDFVIQMKLFKNNIPTHAATLGLTPEQVSGQAADADYYEYVVNAHYTMLMMAKTWTVTKKSVRKGETRRGVVVGAQELPAPSLPDPVTPVAPGVEKRFRTLVRFIKASKNYTTVIGRELGIEAVDHAAPDFTTLQPKLSARVNGDHVELDWDWQGKRAFLDLCELQVDRGDGKGFVILIFSTRLHFDDITPFPGQPTRWAYRAVYRAGNQAVGQWSNTVSVLVPN